MMLRADFNNPNPDQVEGRRCPSSGDLAAFAANLLGEEENERVLVHATGCPECLRALHELGAGVEAIEDDARLLLVPSTVLESAMSLRSAGDGSLIRDGSKIGGPAWLVFARRGAALAACVALAGAGYHIGTSFAASTESAQRGLVASGEGFDFGLLGSTAAEADGLFALVLDSGEQPTELTP